MQLINHTPFPAQMFKTSLDDENKYAMSIAVRITYDIVDGKAIISKDQVWDLKREIWRSEYGIIESDDVFKRGGVDILLFGNAQAPDGSETRQMNVEVRLNNELINKVVVFGDRVWEKSILGMSISTPIPFTKMPVSLENAFGGKAEWDGLAIPYGNNPYGKGYNHLKEDFIGKSLPNIEDPGKLIKKWTDRPDPVGVACLPALCELHARNNMVFKDGKIVSSNARFFNTAFPEMIVNSVKENDTIGITGMSSKPFVFKVPKELLKMKVTMGERTKEWEMYIEQIGIIIDKKQAFMTFRYPINYTMIPHETRKCEIFHSLN